MPALARESLLENKSLGETVIYCDSTGALHPAMIIKVQSDTIVDVEVTEDDGGKIITRRGRLESHTERPTEYLVASDQVLAEHSFGGSSTALRKRCWSRAL